MNLWSTNKNSEVTFGKQSADFKNIGLGLNLQNPGSNVCFLTQEVRLHHNIIFLWYLQRQNLIKNIYCVKILQWKWIMALKSQDFCDKFVSRSSKMWKLNSTGQMCLVVQTCSETWEPKTNECFPLQKQAELYLSPKELYTTFDT